MVWKMLRIGASSLLGEDTLIYYCLIFNLLPGIFLNESLLSLIPDTSTYPWQRCTEDTNGQQYRGWKKANQ
jgi:hypothetical protein